MSDSSGPQADTTTTERKPPTLADIVREKTDDGRRIIDFFLDVMEGRIDGAELCHRMDAAKQLLKHRSRDAARFIAKYRDIPCEHCARRKRGPAKPRSAPVATGRVDAPDPFTQVLLTVLSGADEDLMIRVVRAQTLDGSTIIDFLDDVMQDRVDGFRCHHRIAAAKELIVHIVRDEQPAPTAVVPAHATVAPAHATVVPAKAGTHPRPRQAGPEPGSPEPVEGPAHPEPAEGPVLSTVEGPVEGSEPAEKPAASSPVGPAHTTVVPAQAGTHPRPRQAGPGPAKETQDNGLRRPRRRPTPSPLTGP